MKKKKYSKALIIIVSFIMTNIRKINDKKKGPHYSRYNNRGKNNLNLPSFVWYFKKIFVSLYWSGTVTLPKEYTPTCLYIFI